MNIESYRNYCIKKKGVTEEFPFDEQTLVFKVMGKMFALTNVDGFSRISLKVDPEEGMELKERYNSVVPAYHMNKLHWVNVLMDDSIPDNLIKSWIDKSYELVVQKLTKTQKAALETM